MPYIKQKDRDKFHFNKAHIPENAGQLNYLFTKIALSYAGKPKYQKWNDVIGALECCKQELYRRFIAPYEDKKIKENGDIK